MRNTSAHNTLLCDSLQAYMLFPYNPAACSLRTVTRRRRSVAVSARDVYKRQGEGVVLPFHHVELVAVCV